MILRWKGTIPAETENGMPWWFADFLPICADLAEAKAPQDLDGLNVWPGIIGKYWAPPERPFYWEFHERGFQQAVRWNHWKAIRNGLNKPLQLFDLAKDLAESNNIAAEHPEIVAKIEKLIKEARTESKEWPVP
jgi:arylsulfatase A-like enzyme